MVTSVSHPIRGYEDIIAWQKGYELSLRLYDATRCFPAEERFGLTQQIRRAAVSVPSNIAEGWGRGTTTDYLRFLRIARGSLYELQTQLRLAADLGYLGERDSIMPLVAETDRVLNAFIRSVENSRT